MSPKPLETRLLVTVHRPALWLAAFGAVVLLVLAGFWMSYEYGRSVAGYDVSQSDQEIARLQQALAKSQ